MRNWSPVGEIPDDGIGAWRSGAAGPAVVLVHGMEDTWRSWDVLAARLADRCRVYALDLPWRAGNNYAWRTHGDPATWLARGLSLLPEPPDTLVGHSFGANAVLEHLARRRPARTAVLLAPFYRPASAPVDALLRERSLAGFTGIVRHGLRVKLGARAAKLGDELVDAMGNTLLKQVVPKAFPVFFDYFVDTGNLDLGRVRAPTLVLAGTRDAALAGERAVALAASMPAAQVRPRVHYGHFCHIEQAEEVATEVTDFLDREPVRRSAGGTNP
ncbi:alpha/beta hydrolase [Solihabitans fulvus]|uniref:Alpha/beta hydrolase n=1 Tax=Solihabitans fulvus TaxID=1892852 RepID=A0A5B2WR23_9PSEU|nr:alpha/beta hydrolase [Solihabitans fulvus]KAA2254453.1 alpha/beta hydrolase [Solihabitans fulvus]